MKKILILASGEGTNAGKIMDFFKANDSVKVALVISNNPNAGVLIKAAERNIPAMILDKREFFSDDSIIQYLVKEQIDLVVLAGFLWLLPQKFIQAFPSSIINIHPALLPKYGGKGMYGMNVHKAVIEAKEKESGITVHYVNEKFDEGKIILQQKCSISEGETASTLADKIKALEHKYYSEAILELLK
jgi:phosphoribosylglycinamide formyltransferase-1